MTTWSKIAPCGEPTEISTEQFYIFQFWFGFLANNCLQQQVADVNSKTFPVKHLAPKEQEEWM